MTVILMIIAIALIIYVVYINYQKTKCIVACIKFQDEEIDKLRDMIKGQETDAIIQIRGRLARLETEINEIKKGEEQ